MPDIATIGAFLTSLKTATEIAKALREVDASLEKAETKLKIADLMDALAEARIKAVEIQEAIQEKDKRIVQLEEAMKIKDSLSFEKNGYWIENDKAKEGPFCTHCWDRENKLVRLHQDETNRWFCITHGKPSYPLKSW